MRTADGGRRTADGGRRTADGRRQTYLRCCPVALTRPRLLSLCCLSVVSLLFLCERHSRFAHPSSLRMGLPARAYAFAIALPVALHHAPELVPVDRPRVPVARGLVVREVGVRHCEVDRL